MNRKQVKIALLPGTLSVLLDKLLKQNGYGNVTRVATYSAFIKARKNKLPPDLIVGLFPAGKDNASLNEYSLKHRVAWLPYRFVRERNLLDIGPLVKETDTACYACYEKRLEENNISGPQKSPGKAGQPALIGVMHIIKVMQMYFDRAIRTNKHQNTLFSLHFSAGQLRNSTLLQNPLCPCCRTKPPVEKITVKPKKILYRENGLRILSSEETWRITQRYIHHAGLITGLVQRDNSIQDLSPFQAVSADPLGNNRYRTHAGKGISLTQNKISASLEAIERYCAKYAMLDPFGKERVASFDEIKDTAIHPSRFQIPIQGYADTKKMTWVRAWSLKQKKLCHLPLDYVSLIPIGSNGLASGNCPEEAILHAIFELVERDIYMIMDLQEMVMPDVRTDSIADKRIRDILEQLDKSGMSYSIKFITTDTRIPTFGMYITGTVKHKTAYSYALCSHLDKEIALSRTITEAIQQFPKFSTSSRWLNKNTAHYTQKSTVSLSMSDIPSYTDGDLKKNLDRCILTLGRLGLEPFVVNHSLPGLEFAVVRVLIPGLQPIWFQESQYLVDRVFSLPKKLGFAVKKMEKLNYGQYSGFPYYAK